MAIPCDLEVLGARGSALRRASVLALVFTFGLGCVPELRDERAALHARLAQEQAERLERIESLEGRLLVLRARRRHWSILAERHEEVSALACENLTQHAEALAAAEARQQQRRARVKHRQALARLVRDHAENARPTAQRTDGARPDARPSQPEAPASPKRAGPDSSG